MVWIKHYLPAGGKFFLVGLAAICRAIWNLRNRACFEKKIVRSPTEIICYTCVFLNYWAGLQKEEDPQLLEAGAAALQHNAVNLHPEQDGIPEQAEETAPAAL
jgi:hypothetical protein